MCDYESFRLNYLVEKLGVSDPETIRECVEHLDVFAKHILATQDKSESASVKEIMENESQPDLAYEMLESHYINSQYLKKKFTITHGLHDKLTPSRVRFIAKQAKLIAEQREDKITNSMQYMD